MLSKTCKISMSQHKKFKKIGFNIVVADPKKLLKEYRAALKDLLSKSDQFLTQIATAGKAYRDYVKKLEQKVASLDKGIVVETGQAPAGVTTPPATPSAAPSGAPSGAPSPGGSLPTGLPTKPSATPSKPPSLPAATPPAVPPVTAKPPSATPTLPTALPTTTPSKPPSLPAAAPPTVAKPSSAPPSAPSLGGGMADISQLQSAMMEELKRLQELFGGK